MLAEDQNKALIIHSENQSLTCAYDYTFSQSGLSLNFDKGTEYCRENYGMNITNE